MREIFKKIFAWLTIVATAILVVPVVPEVESASLTDAKVVITDSKPQATNVTYTFYFTTGVSATSITFTFESTFFSNGGQLPAATANYVCPSALPTVTTSTTGYTCSGGTLPAGAATSAVTAVVNPTKQAAAGTADVYYVGIQTNAGESARVKFAIVEGVVVSATVDAILEFQIAGTSSGVTVKNTTTNVTTSATTIPFGTLPLTPQSRVGAQELTVRTNASDGFFVYVFQDHDLTSAGGDTIKCFSNGTCVNWSAATAWQAPTGDLTNENTWGHFGLASENSYIQTDGTCSTSTTGAWGASSDDRWAGFSGTNQVPVMCYPRSYQGSTKVAYRVEITALQPAGEYTNTLTYIATPTY